MSKTVRLGTRLRYPITITKLLKSPGDAIKKQEPLFRYSFKWTREVGDRIHADVWEEELTTTVDWESPTEGDLIKWQIKEGELIERDRPCFVVTEACSHEIQFQGLCAICGKDMTEVNWAAEGRDTERAPISMVHDQTNLTVSSTQAHRTETEAQRRLLKHRKLSLVVDLDQTIIHACIDPTVGDWQRDPTNPNHESVRDVKSFQLDDGPRGFARGCWYYIKMRPGLEQFLKKISEMYELHVYTMGTRAYAQNVAKIVDPQQKLFGNRVISRDENGNMYTKSLQRLFPVSTDMVIIIDDRADVWPRNRPNLIKVSPYDFFKGIGDINSSFLPKRQDLLTDGTSAGAETNGSATTEKPIKKEKPALKDAKADKVPPLDEIVAIGADSGITEQQLQEQERTLEKQIKDRPLLLLQEKLDKEDEETEKASTHSQDVQEARTSSPVHQRHQVLVDNDHELRFLEEHLTRLHKTYFDEYDRRRASHHASSTAVDLESVPDIGEVLVTLKSQALRGLKICLTGLIPNGTDVRQSEIGLQITSFGAEIRDKVSKDVTHLVVNTMRGRTKKVRQAVRIPSIKIVTQDWLAECLSQWAVVDETPFLFNVHPEDMPGGRKNSESAVIDTEAESELVSDADETDDNDKSGAKRKRPKLKLISASGETKDLVGGIDDGAESDVEDEGAGDDGGGKVVEEDEEGLLPDDIEGQLSPIDGLKTFNWGSADEELNEFLASGSDDDEDDEDDGDGDGDEGDNADVQDTETEGTRPESRKRKHNDEEEEDDDDDGSGSERQRQRRDESVTKKLKLRKSHHGSSSLRNQYNGGNNEVDAADTSSLPTPQITGDEEEVSLLKDSSGSRGGPAAVVDDGNIFDDIDEAELEADFMAEVEAADLRQEAEEQAANGEKG